MSTTVQARLDAETRAALERLRLAGLTTSEVIRQGIHMVEKLHAMPKHRKIIGVGQIDIEIPDLSTNKAHMEGFGR
jgi:hypothetical protein